MQRTPMQRGFGIVEVIIIVAVVALIAAGGWYIWQSQSRNNSQTQDPSASQNTEPDKKSIGYEMPEFGVGFDPKDGITPLHSSQDWTFVGVSYKLIRMSTQQLIDKGSAEGTTYCQFKTGPWQNGYHALLTVAVYNSLADLLAVEKEAKGNVTASDVTPTKGYFTIGGKIYAVPQNVQGGSGYCAQDADFESQQRVLLRESLMTLQVIQ